MEMQQRMGRGGVKTESQRLHKKERMGKSGKVGRTGSQVRR